MSITRHAVVIVSSHVCPDNYNSANHVTRDYYIMAYNWLKKAIHTRWLSHDQAVTTIRPTLPSLLTTLEREVDERDDAVARGLRSVHNMMQEPALRCVVSCCIASPFVVHVHNIDAT